MSKFEKYETIKLKRSEIKGADYNPRKISDDAKKRLKRNIKKVGLLGGIIVNKNTMNIVSGHQRVGILDELEKGDYELTVSLVDLTEKEEKEQNMFLNNANAMGEWDYDLIDELWNIGDIDWGMAGFEETDFIMIDQAQREEQDKDITKQQSEEIGKLKTIRAERKDGNNKKNSADNYICLMFKDDNDKELFVNEYKLQNFDPTYIDAAAFMRVILKQRHNEK